MRQYMYTQIIQHSDKSAMVPQRYGKLSIFKGLVQIENYSFMTDKINQLLVLVGERKEKVAKDSFKKRVNSSLQPYRMAVEVSNIK